MCGECKEKEAFSVMIKVRPCTMTRQGHFHFHFCVKFVYGKKSCLCVRHKKLSFFQGHFHFHFRVKFVYGKKICLCVRHKKLSWCQTNHSLLKN